MRCFPSNAKRMTDIYDRIQPNIITLFRFGLDILISLGKIMERVLISTIESIDTDNLLHY